MQLPGGTRTTTRARIQRGPRATATSVVVEEVQGAQEPAEGQEGREPADPRNTTRAMAA